MQNTFEWSINSLDIVLGLVGGLAGVIWPMLAMVFGGYETFKFENSLIGSIYPTSSQDFDPDTAVGSESTYEARNAMLRTVAERGKYFYHYSEYFSVYLLNSFCCCFLKRSTCFQKRLERLKRHNDASSKLADEIDIVKLLYV